MDPIGNGSKNSSKNCWRGRGGGVMGKTKRGVPSGVDLDVEAAHMGVARQAAEAQEGAGVVPPGQVAQGQPLHLLCHKPLVAKRQLCSDFLCWSWLISALCQ